MLKNQPLNTLNFLFLKLNYAVIYKNTLNKVKCKRNTLVYALINKLYNKEQNYLSLNYFYIKSKLILNKIKL